MNAPSLENLLKFSTRVMCENDKMRNRIYNYLRKRYVMPNATLPMLREFAENFHDDGTDGRDDFGIKLLDFALHLEHSRRHIIKASLEVSKR